MYLFGGLLGLVDRLGGLPAHITSPAAGCGAAVCWGGLGSVLATSAYAGGVWLFPCRSSWASVCGAAWICSSWLARAGASSTGEGIAGDRWF